MDPAPQMIGVDIGGSGARAAVVEWDEEGRNCVGELHELNWEDGFEPIPFEEQLAHPGEVTAAEEACASARVERLAELVAGCTDWWLISCDVAAPGLPTGDGAGVLAWRNGPRRATLLQDLRSALEAKGLTLISSMAPICPDSVACAFGEQLAHGGALHGISNALCISGGSGVGEAAVVEGRCLGLNELEPPLARAWELSGGDGASLEDLVAPGRVLAAWRSAGGEGFPEVDGGQEARALLDARDEGVAALVERARVWFDARGLELERVVLSQTIGRLYSEAEQRFARLAARLGGIELVTSSLRGAPLAGSVLRWQVERS